ncbi:hypothetical protein LINGRAHAP2_LOCUS14060 [Linum grandiflorum]
MEEAQTVVGGESERVGESEEGKVMSQSVDAATAGGSGERARTDCDMLEEEEGTTEEDKCSMQGFLGGGQTDGKRKMGLHGESEALVGLVRDGPSPIRELEMVSGVGVVKEVGTQVEVGLDLNVEKPIRMEHEGKDFSFVGPSLPLAVEEENFFQTLSECPETDSDLEKEDSQPVCDSEEEAKCENQRESNVSVSETDEGEDELSNGGNNGVVEQSLRLVERLDLQLKGSSSAAKEVVRRVAEEVLNKRDKAVASSKKERELRRIQIDGSFSDVGNRQTRRETKWQQCSDADVYFIWGNRRVEWAVKDSEGASGGLLTAWDNTIFNVCGTWVGRFSLVVILESMADGFRWCLVNGYGPCDRSLKQGFIIELREIVNWWQMPLCLVGDFNLVRSVEEVSGVGARSRGEMALLNDFIADMELVDLPLSRGSFTWTNFQAQPSLSRLDRVLVNSGWESKFPDCMVNVLPRVCSDHNPLMIVAGQGVRLKRPWRFEMMWLKHEGFSGLLESVWNDDLEGYGSLFRVVKRLKLLKERLKVWNREIFKCNEIEIERCLGLIADLDGQEERGEWTEVRSVQRCLIKFELDKLRRRQEISWRQKSRETSLTLGD